MAQSHDTIIIGAGLAGLTAALELLDQNQRVLILDRDVPAHLGGLARHSFGGVLFADTPQQRKNGIKDSAEAAFADWVRFAELGDGPDDALPRAWAESYCADNRAQIYDWLVAMGQRFLPLPLWVERNGNSVPRWHVCWGTGQGLVRTVLRRIDAHPNRDRLTIRYGIRVDRLIIDAGRVVGAAGQAEADGTPVSARADRVVVATGGINGADHLIRAHWHRDWQPAPPIILTGAHKFADGVMHDAVAQVGGHVHRLDRNWNYAGGIHHWHPDKPGHGLSTVPARSALWVNGQGARIMPPLVSGFDTRALVTSLCAQPAGYGWQIMNRAIALKELAVSGAEMNPAIRDGRKVTFLRQLLLGNRWLYDTLRDNCIDMVVADDLPGLVQKMAKLSVGGVQMDAQRLQSEIDAHDKRLAQGAASDDAQMQAIAELRAWRGDKLRLAKKPQIMDPKSGPLVAIRTFPIARKSLGGIVTDLNCRVQMADGAVIPGLYALGEAAGFGGGNMHGLRGLEGTFLGGALYTGRRLGWAVRDGV